VDPRFGIDLAYPLVLTLYPTGMGMLVGFNWAPACGSSASRCSAPDELQDVLERP